jgi:hypothetical protein
MGTLPVHVERLQASLDNTDLATEQTIERMTQHIRDCAADPAVIAAARHALATFGAGGLGRRNAAWAVWWSIKHALTFIEDDELLRGLTPNPPELELLVSPSVMVRAQDPRGDCDDFSMLLCCFLEVLGCPWEIVTVAVDPNEPERWSHVYAVAVLEDGSRMALDASHGSYPGWEVPSEHVMRYQAWDRSGRPVARRPAAKGLHGYRPRTRRGMRGLGQVCLNVDPDTGECLQYELTPGVLTPTEQQYLSGSYAPTPTASSTPSSFQTELNSLLNAWTQIGSRVIAPTTTVTSGGTTITTPASSTAASSLLSSSGIGGVSLGTILLFAGLAVAVMLLAKR